MRGSALGVLLAALGCGGAATTILPVSAEGARQTSAGCERLFPRAAFQLSSVVEASIPFSDDASFIAVVTAPADQREFRSLLLTQEGMVLFDAVRRDERVEVKRKLPTMDAERFGRLMTDDIRLLLIRPRGPLREIGVTQAGTPICRMGDSQRQVEILLTNDREAQLVEVTRGEVTRRAWLRQIDGHGRAKEILLEHPGVTGYRLRVISQTFDQ